MASNTKSTPQAKGTQNVARKGELSQSLRDNLKRRKSVPKKRPSTAAEKDASA